MLVRGEITNRLLLPKLEYFDLDRISWTGMEWTDGIKRMEVYYACRKRKESCRNFFFVIQATHVGSKR